MLQGIAWVHDSATHGRLDASPPLQCSRCGWERAAGRASARRSRRGGCSGCPPCTAACGTWRDAGCAHTLRARMGTARPAATLRAMRLQCRSAHPKVEPPWQDTAHVRQACLVAANGQTCVDAWANRGLAAGFDAAVSVPICLQQQMA